MSDSVETHAAGSEPIAGTNLTTVPAYTETAIAIAELKQRFSKVVVDVSTKKGLEALTKDVAELRGWRTGLEKLRKEKKAPLLLQEKALDNEAARLTAEIVALEEPMKLQLDAANAAIENARLEKLEAERLRVEAIQKRIDEIRNLPSTLVGKPSVIIAGQLAKLRADELSEDEFAEQFVIAREAHTTAIVRVEQLLTAQQEADAEKKRQAERDEQMAEMQRKLDEQQRLIDEAEEAKQVEQERLAQVERDRVAAEEAAVRAAEQAAYEAENSRVQAISDKIGVISFVPPVANWSSERIDQLMAERKKHDPRDADNMFDFAEFQGAACEAFDEATGHLNEIRTAAVKREHEAYEAAERRQQEEAALQAERERQAAEQKRLSEQAAQLKRDQQAAAKKAEADRLANLGLREAAQAVVEFFRSSIGMYPVVCDLAAALNNDAAQTKPARAKRAARA